jgi:hypothetical protein
MLCLASDECTWVVGKGCQKKTVANANVAQVPKKNAAVAKPQVKKNVEKVKKTEKNANADIPDPKNPWRSGWHLGVPAWYSRILAVRTRHVSRMQGQDWKRRIAYGPSWCQSIR